MKPVGLSGSRGVIRANDADELRAAHRRVVALLARPEIRALRTGAEQEMLIENYIPGREYADRRAADLRAVPDARHLRQARSAGRPVLRGNDLRDPAAAAAGSATGGGGDDRAAPRRRSGCGTGRSMRNAASMPAGVAMLEVAARPIGGLCSRVLRFVGGEAGRCRAALAGMAAAAACGGEGRLRSAARGAGGGGDDDSDPAPRHVPERGRRGGGGARVRASRRCGLPPSAITCSSRCPRRAAISGSSSPGRATGARGGGGGARRAPASAVRDRSGDRRPAGVTAGSSPLDCCGT